MTNKYLEKIAANWDKIYDAVSNKAFGSGSKVFKAGATADKNLTTLSDKVAAKAKAISPDKADKLKTNADKSWDVALNHKLNHGGRNTPTNKSPFGRKWLD